MEMNEIFSGRMPYEEFRLRFQGIRAGLKALGALQKERDRREASRFNFFRVLGIHTREVKTHSAMLACLLDPNGAHGQGDLFLAAFLRMGAGPAGFLPPAFENLPTADWEAACEIQAVAASAHAEESPTGEPLAPSLDSGRIDLVLRHLPSRTLIVIENKIYAGDQSRQLARYYSWMESKRRVWHRQVLLYLTLDGREPGGEDPRSFGCHHPVTATPEATAFGCVSYQKHLIPAFRGTLPEVKAPLIATVLDQYLDALSEL